LERWKDGKMERWKDGKMERWKDGKMERWKDGKMERWKDGKSESSDILVCKSLIIVIDCVYSFYNTIGCKTSETY